jgi:hypothetical protein
MAFIPAAYGLRGPSGPTGRYVHCGVAWLAQFEPPLLAHGAPSKARSYFYPWERRTTERPNTIRLARCKMSSHLFSHGGEIPASERTIHPPLETGDFLADFCNGRARQYAGARARA